MIEARRNRYIVALSVCDVCAVLVAFFSAGIIGNIFTAGMVRSEAEYQILHYGVLLIILLLIYNYHMALIRYFNGEPEHIRDMPARTMMEGRVFLVILDLAVLAFFHYMTQGLIFSWRFIISYIFIYFIFAELFRLTVSYLTKVANNADLNRKNVIIVGSNKRSISFANYMKKHDYLGIEIQGFIDDDDYSGGELKLMARIDDLQSIIREVVVDDIVINLPIRSYYDKISQIIRIAETHGITVHYLTDIFDADKSSIISSRVGVISALVFHTAPIEDWRIILKRMIDVFGSSALLALLSPLMLATALAIRVTSGGPVLFSQVRVGYNKRKFKIVKFRTMVPNAEQLQTELEQYNEMDGPVFKIAKDPRIIPMGRFLRKYSIDELPQLFNVFKGDMSLVGPRPLPLRDYNRFSEDWIRRRFSMRPGITCYWQIGGRNDVSFEQWIRDDLRYVDNWGLIEDIKILLKTALYVFRGKGK